MNILYQFSLGIWDMFLEMSPYLLLGFAFAGILHVLIPKELVTKQIGKKNIWSILKATLLGVPLPLCSCGVIPTGVSFYKNGASKGATNAFLISTPQTGVDSILITSSLMNWPWAIMRPIVALITGVFGGLLTDKMDITTNSIEIDDCSDCNVNPKRHWLIEIIDYAFFEFLPDISRQLIVGILIAVAITIFTPPSVFSEYLTNPFLNMLLILVASIPLYVCATGSVPIASSLLLLGVSPGAVLVFLMAGPATNAATISVLWKSLGKKATLAYLISIIGGALFFGVLIDYILPTTWFTITETVSTHIHGESTSWIAISSAILLMSLILIVEIKKQLPKTHIKMENSKTYTVNGMTCNHCKNSVETNLVKANTIDEAIVDLEAKSVTVKGSATSDEVKAIVDGLGFEFKS
jgi:uncharacterized membrane protein YraQ (UPF0718 family)/copper chaperone CopZ